MEADSRTIDPTTARRLVGRHRSVGGEDAGAEGGHGCRGIHLTGGEHLVAQAALDELLTRSARREQVADGAAEPAEGLAGGRRLG